MTKALTITLDLNGALIQLESRLSKKRSGSICLKRESERHLLMMSMLNMCRRCNYDSAMLSTDHTLKMTFAPFNQRNMCLPALQGLVLHTLLLLGYLQRGQRHPAITAVAGLLGLSVSSHFIFSNTQKQ